MSDDGDKAPVVAATDNEVSSKPKTKAGGLKGKAKKASLPVEDVKYEHGDIVLGRLRGYPPWPARITDPDDLPANVLAQRPKSNAFYCTQFFPVGDFSWLAGRDISPLKSHQIDAFINEPHRKATGALREAYMTAQDPTEWDAHQAAARRRIEEAEEDVDELEDEEEDEEPTAGKRKRSAPAPKKEAKKAKTTKKASEPKKAKADSSKSEKPKAEKAASATAAAEADAHPLASDPEAIKVKDWRHKLQRAFLIKGVPDATEMDTYDELFRSIENYAEMKLEYLQYSKIGKVLKKIAALDVIPRNDELDITNRAIKLMNKWQNEIIQPSEVAEASASKTNGSDGKPAESESAPAPEGETTEEKADA